MSRLVGRPLVAAALSIWTLVPVGRAGAAEQRPNVLLIMADDLRAGGGVFTPDLVETPNLDRLRSRGMSFDRAYVQYPVCNPSRSSMMTGLRAEQTGIVGNDVRLRDRNPDIVTLPQLCRESGWQAHAYGKLFHLGGGRNSALRAQWMDAGRSWDTAQSFEPTKRGKELAAGRNVTGGALAWCAWGAAEGGDDDQPDGQIAAAVISRIKAADDQPWFIGCGFMKPHDPFVAPRKYFDLYPLESLRPWVDPPNVMPLRPESVGFGAYGEAFSKFGETEWRELLRAYCACTTFMDAQLGRVLDVLDERHLWDRTVVIFVGDHGYHTGERRWWNKNTLFERSCRAPMIIAAPGMPRGQATPSLVEFVDIYPTVVELCGLKMPHVGAGVSLVPVLREPRVTVKHAAFTLVTRGGGLYGQSVRTNRWRLTRWSDGKCELFDHESDSEEALNVASMNPGIVQELAGLIENLPVLRRE